MLYLDYAKPLADGKYILSFFADSVADLESISHGQKFVTKNGTDYGVPQAGSTVIVTSPNSGKTTYVMDAEGIWVVTEDISYSAVVANPSDAATAKLEKLKVNDTTYANWTENEIKSIASESGGGKLYQHLFRFEETDNEAHFAIFQVLSYRSTPYGETELYDYLMQHKTTLAGYKYKSLTYSNPVIGYQLFNELELTQSGSYPYPYSIKKVCYYELNADGSVTRNELLNPRFVIDEATEL